MHRYTRDDLRELWKSAVVANPAAHAAVQADPGTSLNQACEAVFALQETVNRIIRRRAGVPLSIRHLLRVVTFAGSHGTGRYTFSQNIVLGCRFFVADQLGQEAGGLQQGIRHGNQSELMNAANDWLPIAEAKLAIPSREWLFEVFGPPRMGLCHNALQVLASDGSIRCRYAGVIAVPAGQQSRGVSESKHHAPTGEATDSVVVTSEAHWASAHESAPDVDLPLSV